MKFNKRRAGVLVGGVSAVGALAALTFGGTSALFSSEVAPQQNQIEAGTVLLEPGTASPVQTLNVAGFMPGDSEVSKYPVKYSGNDAFVGFTVKIVSNAAKSCGLPDGAVTDAQLATSCTGVGTQPMYNGDASSGSLDLAVTPRNGGSTGTGDHQLLDSQVLQNAATCSSLTGIVTCSTEVTNVLVPRGSIAGAANDLIWTNGMTKSINIQSKLPVTAGNVFQGSKIAIDISAKAVQAKNNSSSMPIIAPSVTLPYGIWGTGGQALVLVPQSWS